MSARFRILPEGTPPKARHTFRYDFWAGIARGLSEVGGPATAAVILKKHFAADDFLVASLYSAPALGMILTLWMPRFTRGQNAVKFLSRVTFITAVSYTHLRAHET